MLRDADGAAVVIHAHADDQRTQPSGDSGDRERLRSAGALTCPRLGQYGGGAPFRTAPDAGARDGP